MFNEEDFVPYEQWYRSSTSEPPFRLSTTRTSSSTVINSKTTERSVATIEQSNVEMSTEGIYQGATTTSSQPVGTSSEDTDKGGSLQANLCAMQVQKPGRDKSAANITMHVVEGLSQVIEKANSTSTALQAHHSGVQRSIETVPMTVAEGLPQEIEEALQ
jgi:hypothetical protein